MNRRSFITVIGAAVAGIAAAPLIHVPELPDRIRWKRTQESMLLIPNPEYVDAKFEADWFRGERDPFPYLISSDAIKLRNRLPYRYKQEPDGTLTLIEPFKVVRLTHPVLKQSWRQVCGL